MQSILLSGTEARPEAERLLDDMYRLRHAVFSERLKWTSLNPERREVDRYDALNPVYLVCRDPAGDVVGCWRLLPTTGPYMLKDIFSHLLWGSPAPQRPDIWEISRFAIDPEWRDYVSLGAVGTVVGRMLLDLFDFAEENGITRIVAASDIRFDRILKRAGLQTAHFGPPVIMENSYAVAGWADITPENRARIEARLFSHPVQDAPRRAPRRGDDFWRIEPMTKVQALRKDQLNGTPPEASLKELRQKLNALRRQARVLNQPAVEECLSLAIELTSTRRIAQRSDARL